MPEPGQACTHCHGMGKRMEKYSAVDSDGKPYTYELAQSCHFCQGTGWLPGRSQ